MVSRLEQSGAVLLSGSIQEIREDLLRAIERYEPRLKIRSLTMVPEENNPLNIKFDVDGVIDVDDSEVPVRLAAVVKPEGKVVVHA